MTGFIGERINRQVALVTDDFRVYHRLAPFFERYGVTLLGLRPGEPVPASVQALLGGPTSDPRSVALHDDPEAAWIATMGRLDGRGPARLAVIGVDPGDTFGMALLVDGLVYWWCEAYSVDEVTVRIGRWASALEPGAWAIHIGDGAKGPALQLAGQVRARFPSIRVSVVPERGSTPVAPQTDSRHTDAAIAIALRQA